jgi:hypothetical protein
MQARRTATMTGQEAEQADEGAAHLTLGTPLHPPHDRIAVKRTRVK